jgi:hypothetical protein
MAAKARKPSGKFVIADQDAVRMLVAKLTAPRGSRAVDEKKLLQALDQAAQQYKHSDQKVRQAFFHGLLTGYGVGLKRP